VRRLSASDYDLVRQALARADRGQVDAALLERLANVVAARMGESLPAGVSPAHYLQNVAAAYESMTRES
jgi:adenine C2-methylase RlmN of 23S rRNA A2503 and tRNA A37